MTIPDYQSLMLPVLKLSSAGEVRVSDAVEKLATLMTLSEAERAELLPSGKQTKFSNKVHWAKTYLKQAGLGESTRRGFFKVTERGKAVLSQQPSKIDVNFLSQFSDFLAFRERSSEDETEARNEPQKVRTLEASEQTPDDQIRYASRLINSTLGQDIIERLRLAPPAFFERVIVQLLLAMGYGGTYAQAGKAIGRTGDNGVDGVIDQDTLGLDRVYVQAKRYAENVTVSAGDIRDLFGSLDMHKAAKGLFVTTSTFTKSANETAEKLGKRIVLIDGNALAALMIRFNVGCRVEEVVEIKRIDEEFFE